MASVGFAQASRRADAEGQRSEPMRARDQGLPNSARVFQIDAEGPGLLQDSAHFGALAEGVEATELLLDPRRVVAAIKVTKQIRCRAVEDDGLRSHSLCVPAGVPKDHPEHPFDKAPQALTVLVPEISNEEATSLDDTCQVFEADAELLPSHLMLREAARIDPHVSAPGGWKRVQQRLDLP
eukprot:CAMPEP_0171066282 /NCGR_PEP_ID=MMETSP0766_2-20121228/7332_1 /TAXON_ID=439317 /ORGANISM="Gambierdiscus australes, Strain CAWD 149" /LENGTH=180 /DNA_ID=CAMNT_0011522441 /DNA_START=354 /DNA_END=892 /DNA_ORIENTATION=+